MKVGVLCELARIMGVRLRDRASIPTSTRRRRRGRTLTFDTSHHNANNHADNSQTRKDNNETKNLWYRLREKDGHHGNGTTHNPFLLIRSRRFIIVLGLRATLTTHVGHPQRLCSRVGAVVDGR